MQGESYIKLKTFGVWNPVARISLLSAFVHVRLVRYSTNRCSIGRDGAA